MRKKFSLDPRADLQNYRRALQHMLEGSWVLPRDLMPSPMNAVVVPVDVLDNGTEIIVKAALPGARPEDIDIRVKEKSLIIRARLGPEEELRGAIYLRRERTAGEFARTLTLPVEVNAARAEIHFQYGILTLTLPKTTRQRYQSLKVQAK